MAAMSAILSQINLIKEKLYLDNERDIKKQCKNLRKPILVWLEKVIQNQKMTINKNLNTFDIL